MNTQQTITGSEQLDGFMQTQVNRQLVKYAASQAIMCPTCGNIMDQRKTVCATLWRAVDGGPEEIFCNCVACGKCFDKARPVIEQGIAKALAKASNISARFEVVDGRKLW